MNQRDLIASNLENHPEYRNRSMRYVLLESLTGVDRETCRLICSLADEYRHQTKADDVGIEKEKEWHASPDILKWNAETNQGSFKLL